MNGTAAERGNADCSRPESRLNGGLFGAEAEPVPLVKGGESLYKAVPTEVTVLEFGLFFAETALQLVYRKGKKKWKTLLD